MSLRPRFMIACALLATLIGSQSLAAELTAEQILARARELGGGDARIASGQARLREESEMPRPSPAKLEELIERLFPEPKDPAALPQWRKSVASYREASKGPQRIQQEVTVLFTGSSAEGLLRQEWRLASAPAAGPTQIRLCGGEGNQRATLNWMRGIANITAQTAENLVRDLGRVPASQIPRESVWDSLAMQSESVELLADEIIDGHTCRVLALRNRFAGILQSKLWIDPNRGFICPRREMYAGNEWMTSRHEASSYFKATGTDLWFAGEATETTYNAQGELIMTKRYQFEPESLVVNAPLSPAEFVVNVEPGLSLVDQRPGGRSWRVDAPTRLSFVEGRLDCASYPGLVATSDPRPGAAGFAPRDFGPIARAALLALACVPPLLLAVMVYLVRRFLSPRRAAAALDLKTPGSVH